MPQLLVALLLQARCVPFERDLHATIVDAAFAILDLIGLAFRCEVRVDFDSHRMTSSLWGLLQQPCQQHVVVHGVALNLGHVLLEVRVRCWSWMSRLYWRVLLHQEALEVVLELLGSKRLPADRWKHWPMQAVVLLLDVGLIWPCHHDILR
jgi:hypothetical protein